MHIRIALAALVAFSSPAVSFNVSDDVPERIIRKHGVRDVKDNPKINGDCHPNSDDHCKKDEVCMTANIKVEKPYYQCWVKAPPQRRGKGFKAVNFCHPGDELYTCRVGEMCLCADRNEWPPKYECWVSAKSKDREMSGVWGVHFRH